MFRSVFSGTAIWLGCSGGATWTFDICTNHRAEECGVLKPWASFDSAWSSAKVTRQPQTTTDLKVFSLQSQRLFRFSKYWRSLRMTENLSRCTARITILYTSIGCSLRSLKCKWVLHKRTSTSLWPTEKSLLLPPSCVCLAVEVPALDNLALWPYSALPSEKTAMQPLHYYVLFFFLLWPVKGYRGRGMFSSRRSLVQG